MADAAPPARLILASASPARRELLARLGRPFEVIPADVDEPTGGFADPRTFVQSVSWLKAAAVAPRIDHGLVLAADTIAWIDGQPILKPADEADARRILRTLGGREHELWTGVVLWRRPDDLQLVWQEQTRVAFAALSDAELDRYLATRSWRGHSGAYAIKEQDDPYVRVVRGSLSNVIGLPLETLAQTLDWFWPLAGRK
jgi:septum formation protein